MVNYFFMLKDGGLIFQFRGNIALNIYQKIKVEGKRYRILEIDSYLVFNGPYQMTYPTQTEIYCLVEAI